MKNKLVCLISLGLLLTSACSPAAAPEPAHPTVLATESFLADITAQVAGNRIQVDSLIPLGTDPHSFEPTPQDVAKVASAQLIVINGGGLESWLEKLLVNAATNPIIITASSGLQSRKLIPANLWSLKEPLQLILISGLTPIM